MRVGLLARGLTGAAVLMLSCTAVSAAQKDVKTTPVINTADLQWKDSTRLPPGAKVAVLAAAGDWSVVRIKLPPHYLVPPHSHPNAEAVTVVSGHVGFGFGKDAKMNGPMLSPGAFFALEPGGWHYVWTGDDEGIIDVQVSDPGGIVYANPEDAPKGMNMQ
jgi:quercetin dioxygenase-like cupin family protein